MKKLAFLILIITITFSCENNSTSIPIVTSNNEKGELQVIKLITSPSDSNYIKLDFYPNKGLRMLVEHENGKEKGKYFRWRKNGNLAIEAYRENGDFDRVTREVHENGRTMFEGKRSNNQFQGINNSFYISGALKRRWSRINSKDYGKSVYYHENGLVKEVGEHTDSGYVLLNKWDTLGVIIQSKNDTLTPK